MPEGYYLATPDDIQGLIAQGRTVTEALEITRHVARNLLEAGTEHAGEVKLVSVTDSFDCPLIVSA